MESIESSVPKNRLELLQEKISGAADRIEAEFARTSNSWLECFGSSVFVVETYLSSPVLEALLTPEKIQQCSQRLEALKERLSVLKKEYPDKATVPPNSIKEELLRELDVLKK